MQTSHDLQYVVYVQLIETNALRLLFNSPIILTIVIDCKV